MQQSLDLKYMNGQLKQLENQMKDIKSTQENEEQKQQIAKIEDQLKSNTVKTVIENKSIIDISDNVGGIANITLEGNTIENLILNGRINETSNVYGFGNTHTTKSLEVGKTYTFIVNGRVDQKTLDTDKCLACFIYDDKWNDGHSNYIKSLSDTTIATTFTAAHAEQYGIGCYLYPSDGDRSGNVTINWVMLLEGDWTNKQIPEYFEGIKSVGEWNEYVITSDYKNKTQGDTTANPNIIKDIIGNSLASNFSIGNELQSSYEKISLLDGNCSYTKTQVTGQIPQHLFSFNIAKRVERKLGFSIGNDIIEKVAWLKKNIKSIVCNWWGYGACPSGDKAYLQGYYGSSYVGSKNNISNTPTLLSDTTSSSIPVLIQNDGFVHYIAYTDASDGVTQSIIYTDYVNIEIILNPEATLMNPIEIKSVGKNLFNGIYENKYTDGGSPYRIHEFKDTRTAFIKIEPGKTYYVKKHTTSNRLILGLYNSIDVGSTPLKPLKDCGDDSIEGSITNDVNAKYLSIYVSNDNTEPKMQVEEGTAATEYENYVEDKVLYTLKQPLRNINNIAKDNVSTDGILTRKIEKVEINENSLFYVQESTSAGWKQFEDSLIFVDGAFEQRYKLKHSSSILSNVSVKEIVNNNVEGIAYNWGSGWSYFAIRIKKSKLSTPDINGFKKYLKENPITVYYELAEPITENIGQPLNLKTFKNGTIQVNTNVLPYTTIKYPTNVNSRVSTVEEASKYMNDSLGNAWRTLLILADKELKMKSITPLSTTDDVSKKINEILGVW